MIYWPLKWNQSNIECLLGRCENVPKISFNYSHKIDQFAIQFILLPALIHYYDEGIH